ncbi:hypothetical protein ACJQWK_00636 [Exserohilum turcicum]
MAPQLAWIGLGNMGRASIADYLWFDRSLTSAGHVSRRSPRFFGRTEFVTMAKSRRAAESLVHTFAGCGLDHGKQLSDLNAH